jgi:hypothetical protein
MTIFCEGHCGKEFHVPDELETKTTLIAICVECYPKSVAILKRLLQQVQIAIGGTNE